MAIKFNEVAFTYQKGTPFESQALHDINLEIEDGSFTAIVGHTGSGKSTLLQHLNGLLKPTEGEIQIGEQIITPETPNKALNDLRKQVGIVFQFPEAQLFEETVIKDVAFAPKNFGKTESEAEAIAEKMLQLVGLPESIYQQSPFDLSGGQMRRVAIAGILAMEPKILVLDEPTAGLDPRGRVDMMAMFEELHREQNLTIILVTHQMDDVANYADYAIIMSKGTIIKSGTPRAVFSDPDFLLNNHLNVPTTTLFSKKLTEKGFSFANMPLTEAELADDLVELLSRKGGHDANE
ncbi:energy-coupling factor ABC transporter ATP-binding protein [Dellaglioa algida]|uniref:energy-coupling factor ABC transporter ATP-binding protein n=1 Tax=Dellaglioa algida TaxID=105612 RepID=UPI0024C4A9B9|nr:energy-coupling factor ABC transporter ATP-binding protein [Dellaglioa algida]MDK1728098.1 energy-coupling factor ABC transporter ATP-binding protein [Dellaglioa algida]MDK1735750.1 energy-coupling factor ABC transporter ATP-binding protein [Dellaglioa algida]MDK1737429.1 energy-coupling factor ABC transporter ATP-binding protein [Dellaglioa algida]